MKMYDIVVFIHSSLPQAFFCILHLKNEIYFDFHKLFDDKLRDFDRQSSNFVGFSKMFIKEQSHVCKSIFCFDHIHNVSNPQLRILLLARLTI